MSGPYKYKIPPSLKDSFFVSTKKIIKFTVLISIVSVSLTSLVLTLKSKAELTQYMVEDSKYTTQIQVDNLLLKIDGLEQTISELKSQINSIPIDDTEFYSQDNLEKTAIMFTTVLHQDEGLDIKVISFL